LAQPTSLLTEKPCPHARLAQLGSHSPYSEEELTEHSADGEVAGQASSKPPIARSPDRGFALSGDRHFLDAFQQPLKIGLRRQAHGSVCVQEREISACRAAPGTVARPFPTWHSLAGRRETGRREEAALAAAIGISVGAKAQIILSGNDEKTNCSEICQFVAPPGKDTVSIIDIRDRIHPRIVTTLPLINTVFGPPTNLAVTPDQTLAIVVNSLDAVQDGDKWKPVPNDKVFVIDLTAKPPVVIATLHAGKQVLGHGGQPGRRLCGVAYPQWRR